MGFFAISAAVDDKVRAILVQRRFHRRAREMCDFAAILHPAFFFRHGFGICGILRGKGQTACGAKRSGKDDRAIAAHGIAEGDHLFDPVGALVAFHEIEDFLMRAGRVVPAAQGIGDKEHVIAPAHMAGVHKLLGLFAGVGLAHAGKGHDKSVFGAFERRGPHPVRGIEKSGFGAHHLVHRWPSQATTERSF